MIGQSNKNVISLLMHDKLVRTVAINQDKGQVQEVLKNAIDRTKTGKHLTEMFLLWPGLLDVLERMSGYVLDIIWFSEKETLLDLCLKGCANIWESRDRSLLTQSHEKEQLSHIVRAMLKPMLKVTEWVVYDNVMSPESGSPVLVIWDPALEPITTWALQNEIRVVRVCRRQNGLYVSKKENENDVMQMIAYKVLSIDMLNRVDKNMVFEAHV